MIINRSHHLPLQPGCHLPQCAESSIGHLNIWMSIVEIMCVFFCDFSFSFLLYRHYWWIRVKMADPLPLSIHPLQDFECPSYSHILVISYGQHWFHILVFFCCFLKLFFFFCCAPRCRFYLLANKFQVSFVCFWPGCCIAPSPGYSGPTNWIVSFNF